MSSAIADIIARLQREILPLQGYKPHPNAESIDVGLGRIKQAFPNNTFPLGAVHEFCCTGAEDVSATAGFIAAILGSLMRDGGVALWISSSRTVFPPSLQSFSIQPDKIVFIDLKKQKDVMWAMEEALKCDGLAAVVGEISEVSFTASRRLQLAVEKSRVTGFLVRINPRNINTTACVTRWKISCLPSMLHDQMPGVGFPKWHVELLKVRNGRPGYWQVEWRGGYLRHASKLSAIPYIEKKKTG